jgi:hypothetical protein
MTAQTKSPRSDSVDKATERIVELSEKAAENGKQAAERIAELNEKALAGGTKAAERIADLNEKAVANGRKALVAFVNSYEKDTLALVDSYEQAVGAANAEWLDTVAAHVDLARELTKATTSAAREVIG